MYPDGLKMSEKKDLQNFDGLKPHFPIQLPGTWIYFGA